MLEELKVIPAGRYWIGDPCYAIESPEMWMGWLYAADFESVASRWSLDAPVEIGNDAFRVIAFSTAYGDGQYGDEHGHLFPVDAGLLGAVPLELIELQGFDSEKMDWLMAAGIVVEFTEETVCGVDDFKDQHIITFGRDIHIETGDSEDTGDEEW